MCWFWFFWFPAKIILTQECILQMVVLDRLCGAASYAAACECSIPDASLLIQLPTDVLDVWVPETYVGNPEEAPDSWLSNRWKTPLSLLSF